MLVEQAQGVLITEALQDIRAFFASGKTLSWEFRKDCLLALYDFIASSQEAIFAALHQDLNKSQTEAYMTEVGLALAEIRFQAKHVRRWARPRRVRTALSQFPATVRIHPEPYGTALIMSPWNYPFLLSIVPLASALAAGNTVLLKPSAYSPATSALLKEILENALPAGLVRVVEGGRQENQALLDQKFDYIFFTGSPTVGRLVMAKAARHVTPVSLELGGKSPCIVDESANIKMAGKRIVFGKLVNAGQTCVAPDYILVAEHKLEELLESLQLHFAKVTRDEQYYRENYPKIINNKQFVRLLGLLENQEIFYGGKADSTSLQIEPTLVLNPPVNSPLMQEEIFGPILPLLTYQHLAEAIRFVQERPRPLALYHFTENREYEDLVRTSISFGGGCVNDCLLHMISPYAPFGGVGNSGLGRYHGKFGFTEFSHLKTVLKKPKFLDLPVRYHRYGKTALSLLRKVMR